MVCHLDIPQYGVVALRAVADGVVRHRPTVVEYKTDLDQRISFAAYGWKNFVRISNLQIGQAILITARNTETMADMQLVFEILTDLPFDSDSDSDLDSMEY